MIQDEKIIKGAFWRLLEKTLIQLVTLIVSLVIARALSPDNYGTVAKVTIAVSITEVFVTSGAGAAIIQKKDISDDVISTLFWCNLLLSTVIYIIVYLTAPLIEGFYNTNELSSMLRVLSLKIPISAINSIQTACISKELDFKKFFIASLLGTIVSGVIGIAMAYNGFGAWSLITQILVDTIIDTIVLLLMTKWKPAFIFLLKESKPLIGYGWKILVTDLIGTIFNQLNAMVIGKKYTSSDLAYYTQGKKFPDTINSNVCATLCAVLFPAMSSCNNFDEIKIIRKKTLKTIEFILFPTMFGLFFTAKNLVSALLTDKWLPAVPYVRIFCLVSVIGVFGTTLIQEIKAIGRSDIALKLEFIKKPLYILTLLIAVNRGVVAIAITSMLNVLIEIAINVYPVKKIIGFSFKEYMLDAVPALAMSLIMSLIVLIIGCFINNNFLCLCIQVLVGMSIYILLSIVTKNESFYLIIKTIQRDKQ